MAIGAITTVGKFVYRYRKQIYQVLVAQDRAINKSFKIGGYSKWTTAGVRHGALAGSAIGTLLSNTAEDSPGNGFQTIQPAKQPSSYQQDKTRSGSTRRYSSRYNSKCKPNYNNRYSNARRYN